MVVWASGSSTSVCSETLCSDVGAGTGHVSNTKWALTSCWSKGTVGCEQTDMQSALRTLKLVVMQEWEWEMTPTDHRGPGDGMSFINKALCQADRLKLEALSTQPQVWGWLERLMGHTAGWLCIMKYGERRFGCVQFPWRVVPWKMSYKGRAITKRSWMQLRKFLNQNNENLVRSRRDKTKSKKVGSVIVLKTLI